MQTLAFKLGILALILTISSRSVSQCISSESNVFSFQLNDRDYELVREVLSWQDAAACAVERGGKLAEIVSAGQQDLVFAELLNNAGIDPQNTIAPDGGGASYVWLGGNDLAEEGKWIWDGDNDGSGDQFWQGAVNGNPVNNHYVNWGIEPDNFSNQDALGLAYTNWPLGVAGQWNDIKASNQLYFLIEYPGEPSQLLYPQSELSFQLYPNPCNGRFKIKRNDQDSQILGKLEIFDLQGIKVRVFDFPDPGHFLDISDLTNGFYRVILPDNSSAILAKTD